MRRVKLILLGYLLAISVAVPLATARPSAEPASVDAAFVAIPVYIDPLGKPLAAYQFELTETDGRFTVVGLENGEHPAFAQPPYYDQRAIQDGSADRVIAAAYSLLPADQLPTRRTRVATVHVMLQGSAAPDVRLKLVTAGNPDGKPIEATIAHTP